MIRLAQTDDEIRRAFPVMRQLRPQLADAAAFVVRVQRQRRDGYELALLEADSGEVAAVGGYRIGHNLAWGRFLYVDDLVTDEAARSAGHGARLLDWLVERARQAGCDELHLDSGVQRFAAHRFYLRHRLEITSHHFAMRL